MTKSKSKKGKLKKWYKNKFPHIPFLIVLILFIVSITIVLFEFYKTNSFEGMGYNIATEIFGILITVLIVDFYIRKKQEKEWEVIHKNVKSSILGLLMGFDLLLLFFKNKLDDTIDKKGNAYSTIFNNFEMLYKKMDEQEFISAINQITEQTNKHIEGILSDIKLNPKSEYLKEILGIRSQSNFLATVPNLMKSPMYKSNGFEEPMQNFILKSFKAIIWNLSELDKKFLFEYPKVKPIPTEYISYLAFDKAMGISKDVQEVRELILSKSGLDKIDEILKKYSQQSSKTDNYNDKN